MKIKPILETTLAKDFNSASGITHPAGTKISFATKFTTKKFGELLLTTPNPVTLNLDFAEKVIAELKSLESEVTAGAKKMVFSKLGVTQNISGEEALKNDPDAEVIRHHDDSLYYYLEASMSIVISLFTAIETFTNLVIPHDYVHNTEDKNGDPVQRDKTYIERYYSLEDKIDILMVLKSKPDLKKQPSWMTFKELKNIRDNVIHLKSSGKTYIEQYNPIFTSLFDLEAEKAYKQVTELIDYLEPSLLS